MVDVLINVTYESSTKNVIHVLLLITDERHVPIINGNATRLRESLYDAIAIIDAIKSTCYAKELWIIINGNADPITTIKLDEARRLLHRNSNIELEEIVLEFIRKLIDLGFAEVLYLNSKRKGNRIGERF